MTDRFGTLRHGLIRAWCPSIAGGGYVLPDLSASRANGTLTNMDGQTNWVGRAAALNFADSADHVRVRSIPTASIMSVSAWFAHRSSPANAHSIYCNNAASLGPDALFVLRTTTASTLAMSWFSGGYATNSTQWTFDTNWHHFAWVADASGTIRYYIDGVPYGTATRPSGGTAGATGCLSAGDLGGSGFGALGAMDDVRIYTRTLQPSEVLTLASRRGIGLLPTRHRRANVLGSQFWLRDAGTWKKATGWIKVNGVWTKATPKIRVSGAYK